MTQKYTIKFIERDEFDNILTILKVVGTDRADTQRKAFHDLRHKYINNCDAIARMYIRNYAETIEYLQRIQERNIYIKHSPNDGMDPTEVLILEAEINNQNYLLKDMAEYRDSCAKELQEAKTQVKDKKQALEEAEQTEHKDHALHDLKLWQRYQQFYTEALKDAEKELDIFIKKGVPTEIPF